MSAPSRDLRYVTVDGGRVRVSVTPDEGLGAGAGSGPATAPPLLLITGLGAGLELAGPLEAQLNRRGVRTISYDAPGVGESTPYIWPRRMSGVARTAEHLLDALGVDTVDVLGVSLGGGVAQQLAHQAPDRVRRLVLAATGPGMAGVPGSPLVLWRLTSPRRYHQPDYYRRIAGTLYGGIARTDPDALLHGSLARFTHRPTAWGYASQLYSIAGWTSVTWLGRLRQPTLVLAGDDDPIVPLANGRILARMITDTRLHIVRGGGHLFLLEQPSEVAGIITDFLHHE